MNDPSNGVKILLICIINASVGGASTQTLSVSEGSGVPGSTVTVSIGLSSKGGTQAAGVQWDLTYSISDLSPAAGTYWATGADASAAGKQASCNLVTPGDIRCLVAGLNNTSIQDGDVATVTLQIASGTTSTSSQVNLTGAAGTDPSGNSITMTGSGAIITINQPPGTAPVRSMAQLASGGGWDTTLTLVNTGVAASEVTLKFFGNDGSSLQLPFAFPQGASPLVASTLDPTLNTNSLLVIDSQQPTNPNAQVGSAQLLTNGNVGGFAIFKYAPTGQEAVVPLETRNSPSYALAFDNTGVLATGVAIANIATQPASIPVVIRDDTGVLMARDTISLAPQGHTSFLLTSNYEITKGRRGTIEFETPPSGHITALGLRANGRALTTVPVLAEVTAGGGSMAHVASGSGWQTTLTLVNTGTSSPRAQLSFFDDNGKPLFLPLTFPQTGVTLTTSRLTQTIATGATLVIQTQASDPVAAVGSAQLTVDGTISGFAIFRYNPTGQEAVVPLETRNASAYVLAFDNTNGLVTGVALANVSNQVANVPVVLRNDSGASLGTSMINLAAHGHASFILTDSYAFRGGKAWHSGVRYSGGRADHRTRSPRHTDRRGDDHPRACQVDLRERGRSCHFRLL